jgi:extracellular matrix regulatory protein B
VDYLFIHIGEDVVVQTKDVVAIIDGQVIESSTITSEFLRKQHDNKPIVKITKAIVKSIVITDKNIYFSPLSSSTLKRRSQFQNTLETIEE